MNGVTVAWYGGCPGTSISITTERCCTFHGVVPLEPHGVCDDHEQDAARRHAARDEARVGRGSAARRRADDQDSPRSPAR